MENNIDQSAVNLAKAIRQSESGGDFTAKGKSGEHGGYQYTPDTWNAVAPQYGINVPIEKATPEQQNAVTYNRIKKWKDNGYDVTQIASMWNAGEGEPNAYTGKFGKDTSTHKKGDPSKGVNKFGAAYDVPAYVTSVGKAYQQIKAGSQVGQDFSNPSSTQSPQFPFVSQANTNQQQPTDPHTGVLGTNPNDSLFGKIADNSIVRGIVDAVPGAKAFSEQTGKALNYANQSITDAVTGSDLSKYSEQPDIKKQLAGSGKLLGTVGTLAATGLASGLFVPKEILKSSKYAPVVEKILPGVSQGVKRTATQIVDELSGVKGSSATERYVIAKIIEQAMPSYRKENPELFSLLERSPALAKGLGFLVKGGKLIVRTGLDIGGIKWLSHLMK